MRIGAPREIHEGERRVALTPQSAQALKKLGYDCLIGAGAGKAARCGRLVLLARGADAALRNPAWPEQLIVIQSARAQLQRWLTAGDNSDAAL